MKRVPKDCPGSACPVKKRLHCHEPRGPTGERGEARLRRRLSRTKKQPMPPKRKRKAQPPVAPSSEEAPQAQAEGLGAEHSVAQLAIYAFSTMAQTGVSGPVVVEGESFSDALFASAG